MKKNRLIVLLLALTAAVGAYAWPCHPGWRPGPHPMHHFHHHSYWGRGGCNFWPGFVGGVIGGVVANTVVQPQPVVVQQPVVQQAQPTVVVVQQPAVQQTAPVVVQQSAPAVVQTAPQPVQQVQNVWVEGRYVDQPQGNGTVIRIWQPGHYEARTVVVQ